MLYRDHKSRVINFMKTLTGRLPLWLFLFKGCPPHPGRVTRSSHRHSKSLALGPTVLEPELNVLWLESRKLLAVWHAVELFRVLEDEVVTWVGVEVEPLLESGHLRHGVDESSVSFPTLLRQRPMTNQTTGKWGHLGMMAKEGGAGEYSIFQR